MQLPLKFIHCWIGGEYVEMTLHRYYVNILNSDVKVREDKLS